MGQPTLTTGAAAAADLQQPTVTAAVVGDRGIVILEEGRELGRAIVVIITIVADAACEDAVEAVVSRTAAERAGKEKAGKEKVAVPRTAAEKAGKEKEECKLADHSLPSCYSFVSLLFR